MHAQSIQVRFWGLGPRTLILSKTFNLFLPYSSHLEIEKIGLIAHVDLLMILHRWFCLSSSSPDPHLHVPVPHPSSPESSNGLSQCFLFDFLSHLTFVCPLGISVLLWFWWNWTRSFYTFYFTLIYFPELSSFSNVLDFPQSSLQKCQFFPYWVNSFLMLQLSITFKWMTPKI